MDDVCPFPAAARKLMTLVDDDAASIDAIADVVSTDPVLAAQVLRIANSAAFHPVGAQPVGELHHAIVAIGLEALRTMAGAMALLASLATDDELSLDLHARSTVCGSIAAAVAADAEAAERGLPFVCGLLCEVGALACLAVDGAVYSELRTRMREVEGQWPVQLAVAHEEWEVIRYGVAARTIGARLLRRHRLPEEVARAIDAAPCQTPKAPLVIRATAFARIASPLALGWRGAASGRVAEQIEKIARATCLLEIDTDELVHRCVGAAAKAQQTLYAVRA